MFWIPLDFVSLFIHLKCSLRYISLLKVWWRCCQILYSIHIEICVANSQAYLSFARVFPKQSWKKGLRKKFFISNSEKFFFSLHVEITEIALCVLLVSFFFFFVVVVYFVLLKDVLQNTYQSSHLGNFSSVRMCSAHIIIQLDDCSVTGKCWTRIIVH